MVLRARDGSAVLTVRPRNAFTSSAAVTGAVQTRVRRAGRSYVSPHGTMTQAASGVLTGPLGEIIVRDVPDDGELIRVKFATPAPEQRAVLIATAVLYEHDFRR